MTSKRMDPNLKRPCATKGKQLGKEVRRAKCRAAWDWEQLSQGRGCEMRARAVLVWQALLQAPRGICEVNWSRGRDSYICSYCFG